MWFQNVSKNMWHGGKGNGQDGKSLNLCSLGNRVNPRKTKVTLVIGCNLYMMITALKMECEHVSPQLKTFVNEPLSSSRVSYVSSANSCSRISGPIFTVGLHRYRRGVDNIQRHTKQRGQTDKALITHCQQILHIPALVYCS